MRALDYRVACLLLQAARRLSPHRLGCGASRARAAAGRRLMGGSALLPLAPPRELVALDATSGADQVAA